MPDAHPDPLVNTDPDVHRTIVARSLAARSLGVSLTKADALLDVIDARFTARIAAARDQPDPTDNVTEWIDNLNHAVANCYDDTGEHTDPYASLLSAAEDLLAALDGAAGGRRAVGWGRHG